MFRAQWAAVFFCFTLAGCEDGSGKGSPPITPSVTPHVASHALTAYDIAGTAADLTGGVAPIDSGVNSGKFSVTLAVRDAIAGLLVQLYLSDDNAYSEDDTRFYNRYCDSSRTCISTPQTLACTFAGDKQLSCADDAAVVEALVFLDALPKDAWIIARTVDTRDNSFDSWAHPVKFSEPVAP